MQCLAFWWSLIKITFRKTICSLDMHGEKIMYFLVMLTSYDLSNFLVKFESDLFIRMVKVELYSNV